MNTYRNGNELLRDTLVCISALEVTGLNPRELSVPNSHKEALLVRLVSRGKSRDTKNIPKLTRYQL